VVATFNSVPADKFVALVVSGIEHFAFSLGEAVVTGEIIDRLPIVCDCAFVVFINVLVMFVAEEAPGELFVMAGLMWG
jgi:hypothetical protein